MQSLKRRASLLVWLGLVFALSVAAGGLAHATKYYVYPGDNYCYVDENHWQLGNVTDHDDDATRAGNLLTSISEFEGAFSYLLSGDTSITTDCGLVQLKSWWGKAGINSDGSYDMYFWDWTGNLRHQVHNAIGPDGGRLHWERGDGCQYEFVNSGSYQTTPSGWSPNDAQYAAGDQYTPIQACAVNDGGTLKCDEIYLKFWTFGDAGWTATTLPPSNPKYVSTAGGSGGWTPSSGSDHSDCVEVLGDGKYLSGTDGAVDTFGSFTTDAQNTTYNRYQLVAVLKGSGTPTFTASYTGTSGWEWFDLKVPNPSTTGFTPYYGPIVRSGWNPVAYPLQSIRIKCEGAGTVYCDQIYIRVWTQ